MRGSFAATSTGIFRRRRRRERGVRGTVQQRPSNVTRSPRSSRTMISSASANRLTRRSVGNPQPLVLRIAATPRPSRARAAHPQRCPASQPMPAITLGLSERATENERSELHARGHGGDSTEQRPCVVHPMDFSRPASAPGGDPRSTPSRALLSRPSRRRRGRRPTSACSAARPFMSPTGSMTPAFTRSLHGPASGAGQRACPARRAPGRQVPCLLRADAAGKKMLPRVGAVRLAEERSELFPQTQAPAVAREEAGGRGEGGGVGGGGVGGGKGGREGGREQTEGGGG